MKFSPAMGDLLGERQRLIPLVVGRIEAGGSIDQQLHDRISAPRHGTVEGNFTLLVFTV